MNQKKTDQNRILLVLFLFITILQMAYITYAFAVEKKGFHSDEPWSYGFANSYYQPYIYKEGNSRPQDIEQSKNFGTWLTGETFRDYLTANTGETFAYSSVYDNKRYDQSPPLYCMLLHTVCSLFPDTFSWWYGFAVNLTMFAGIQVLLFLLVERVSKSRALALVTCSFFGFTLAAMGMVIYLRMYAVMTFFTMLYLVLLERMHAKGFRKIWKESIALVLCMALGEFTQYFFYVFAFFMTGCLCVSLLFQKKYRELFSFAGVSLLGAGAGLALYPTALEVMLGGTTLYEGGANLSFWYDVEFCLNLLTIDTLGVGWYVDHYLFMEILVFGGIACIILGLICFLLRGEAKFAPVWKGLLEKAKDVRENKKALLMGWIGRRNGFLVSAVVSLFASLVVISRIFDVFSMGVYGDRYLFFLMPMWLAAVCYGMYLFLGWLGKKRWQEKTVQKMVPFCMLVPVLLSLFGTGQMGQSPYLFQEFDTAGLEDVIDGADCILVLESQWKLEWYSVPLQKAANVYIVHAEDYEEQMQEINEAALGEKKVLLLAQNGFRSAENLLYGTDDDPLAIGRAKMTVDGFVAYLLKQCEQVTQAEYLGEETTISGLLNVYRLE